MKVTEGVWICANVWVFDYLLFTIPALFYAEAKEQVLANLANFAYDPQNMEDLIRLQVTELFLDMLTEENENFVEFGIGE